MTLFKNAERDSKLDLSDYIPLPPVEESVPEPSPTAEEPKEEAAAAEQGRAKRSKPDPYVHLRCDILFFKSLHSQCSEAVIDPDGMGKRPELEPLRAFSAHTLLSVMEAKLAKEQGN